MRISKRKLFRSTRSKTGAACYFELYAKARIERGFKNGPCGAFWGMPKTKSRLKQTKNCPNSNVSNMQVALVCTIVLKFYS